MAEQDAATWRNHVGVEDGSGANLEGGATLGADLANARGCVLSTCVKASRPSQSPPRMHPLDDTRSRQVAGAEVPSLAAASIQGRTGTLAGHSGGCLPQTNVQLPSGMAPGARSPDADDSAFPARQPPSSRGPGTAEPPSAEEDAILSSSASEERLPCTPLPPPVLQERAALLHAGGGMGLRPRSQACVSDLEAMAAVRDLRLDHMLPPGTSGLGGATEPATASIVVGLPHAGASADAGAGNARALSHAGGQLSKGPVPPPPVPGVERKGDGEGPLVAAAADRCQNEGEEQIGGAAARQPAMEEMPSCPEVVAIAAPKCCATGGGGQLSGNRAVELAEEVPAEGARSCEASGGPAIVPGAPATAATPGVPATHAAAQCVEAPGAMHKSPASAVRGCPLCANEEGHVGPCKCSKAAEKGPSRECSGSLDGLRSGPQSGPNGAASGAVPCGPLESVVRLCASNTSSDSVPPGACSNQSASRCSASTGGSLSLVAARRLLGTRIPSPTRAPANSPAVTAIASAPCGTAAGTDSARAGGDAMSRQAATGGGLPRPQMSGSTTTAGTASSPTREPAGSSPSSTEGMAAGVCEDKATAGNDRVGVQAAATFSVPDGVATPTAMPLVREALCELPAGNEHIPPGEYLLPVDSWPRTAAQIQQQQQQQQAEPRHPGAPAQHAARELLEGATAGPADVAPSCNRGPALVSAPSAGGGSGKALREVPGVSLLDSTPMVTTQVAGGEGPETDPAGERTGPRPYGGEVAAPDELGKGSQETELCGQSCSSPRSDSF